MLWVEMMMMMMILTIHPHQPNPHGYGESTNRLETNARFRFGSNIRPRQTFKKWTSTHFIDIRLYSVRFTCSFPPTKRKKIPKNVESRAPYFFVILFLVQLFYLFNILIIIIIIININNNMNNNSSRSNDTSRIHFGVDNWRQQQILYILGSKFSNILCSCVARFPNSKIVRQREREKEKESSGWDLIRAV